MGVTNVIQNLYVSLDYDDPDKVQIRDGSGLHIIHVGTSKKKFLLKHITPLQCPLCPNY